MSSVKDIVSSVFKRYEGEYLSPERIRNECSILSKATDEDNPGDPGRTARDFFNDGFVQRDASSNYCYDSSKIPDSLVNEFSQFENLYNRLPEDFNPTAVLKIPLGNVPEDNCIDYLASELKKYKEKYKSYGIHYFGIKYSKAIVDKNINISEIVQKANESDNWKDELRKMIKIYNIAVSRNEVDYESDNKINNLATEEIKSVKYTPAQTIYYGVPGCGKSYSIENELRKLGITKTMEADCTKRVVFHPEYTNADFVGQILPQSIDNGEKISYSFVAGPFTQILAKAYTHKNIPYALVIEEINRGNAAAIFGELFQLLDRLDKDEVEMSNEVSYQKNWSCYPVTNDNINNEIFAAYDKYKNDKDTCIFEPFIAEENFKKYKLNICIRLPPNLSILATMNTSDQNVFILDNAFQRRWDMVLVKNEFVKAETEEEQKNIDQQKTALIEGSKIKWENFHKTVNDKISQFSKENNFSSMIDKRLGCWFVKAVPYENDANGNYIITEDSFKHKILKYLWDDAFKFSHEDIFEAADNFEALLEKVKMSELNFGIFKNIDFPADESEPSESES